MKAIHAVSSSFISQHSLPVHHSNHGGNGNASLFLWMLVDGVGLAVIAACTILEGVDLWGDFFNEHYSTNREAIAFWISGRTCQVMGLLFLITHAATFQIKPEIEKAGMTLLTAGPILNICACSLFHVTSIDPYYLFNRQWLVTEIIELIGISILDLSLIDAEHYLVLTAEVVGFAILSCAAILDFDFSSGGPQIGCRLDMVHVSDCFGLGLLTVVAIGQYYLKESKHNQHTEMHSQPVHQSSGKSL